MSDFLQKIILIVTGVVALWFSFDFVHQPMAPFYHNMFLFIVSWVLFYSFVDIAFQPVSVPDISSTEKKRQKIRRKNSVTLEKS